MRRFPVSSLLLPSLGWVVSDLPSIFSAAKSGAHSMLVDLKGGLSFPALSLSIIAAAILFGAAPWMPPVMTGCLIFLFTWGLYFGCPRHPAFKFALSYIAAHRKTTTTLVVVLLLAAMSSQAHAIIPFVIGGALIYLLGSDIMNHVNQMANFSTNGVGQGTKFIREHSQDYLFGMLNALNSVLDVAIPVVQQISLLILLVGGIAALLTTAIRVTSGGEQEAPRRSKIIFFIVLMSIAGTILATPASTKSFYMDWLATPALKLGSEVSDKILSGHSDVSNALGAMMQKMGVDVTKLTGCDSSGLSSYQSSAVALGCSLNSIIGDLAFPIALADFANALGDAPDAVFSKIAGVDDTSVWPLSSELYSIRIKLTVASWFLYAAGFVVVLAMMLSMLMLLFRVILLGVFFPICVLGLPLSPFRPALISLVRSLINSAAVLIGWAGVILVSYELYKRGYVDLLNANPDMVPKGIEAGKMLASSASFAVFIKSVTFGPLFMSTIMSCVTTYVLLNAASGIATMLTGGSDGLDPARQATSTLVGGLVSGATAGGMMLSGQFFGGRGGGGGGAPRSPLPAEPAEPAPEISGDPNARPD